MNLGEPKRTNQQGEEGDRGGRAAFVSLRAGGSSLVPFARAWEYQKALVERRIRDEAPDTFLFVEHPPTITRGRGLQRGPGDPSETRAMPMTAPLVGTEYFEIERGGDLTWHGPGQLVVYPIVKLDGRGFGAYHDVAGYLRRLEALFGGWLARHGLATESREGATGIWVVGAKGNPARSPANARKIASIGIAVRKWVTYHGIGVNLANALDGFRAISPCGFDPAVMTTLAAESAEFGREPWLADARARIEAEVAQTVDPAARVRVEEV